MALVRPAELGRAIVSKKVTRFFGQKQLMGALPTLQTSVDSGSHRKDYYSIGGFMEMHCYPVTLDSSNPVKDTEPAKRSWQVSVDFIQAQYNWTNSKKSDSIIAKTIENGYAGYVRFFLISQHVQN